MATIDPKDAEWQAFHDWECGPGWDHYIGVKGHGSLDQAIATNLSEANAALIVSEHNQSLRSQAGVSEAVAWQHRFELPDGHIEMEVNTCPDHPFGRAGRDYSDSAVITSAPLFPHPAPIEITEAMVERAAEAAYNADLRVGFWAEWSEIDEADPANKTLKDQFRAYARASLQGETK